MLYDLIIRNGLVVRGDRTTPVIEDVAVLDGRIAQIGGTVCGDAKRVVDATGLVVAPGFIDPHTHSDAGVFVEDYAHSKIYQGVTSEVTGNCGLFFLPAHDGERQRIYNTLHRKYPIENENPACGLKEISEYLQLVDETKTLSRLGVLVGHGRLRSYVMGEVGREATEDEILQMEAKLDDLLTQGALGMSFGLTYAPGCFCGKEEMVRLSAVVKKHEKVVAVHIRNEGIRVFEALEEMLDVARESGVHLHISHLKIMSAKHWGRANELLEMIEKARMDGCYISFDQYPYLASSTSLTAILPPWARAGGHEETLERLRHIDTDVRLREDLAAYLADRGGGSVIEVIGTNGCMVDCEGLRLTEIAEKLGVNVIDAVAEVLLTTDCAAKCIFFAMDEGDMNFILANITGTIGSDGSAMSYTDAGCQKLHPRNFGTFPRFFQLVREQQCMPIEDAVYKVTKLPAQLFSLAELGELKVGYHADICIFNADKIRDCCTFAHPAVKPEGIHTVIVAGEIVLQDGQLTGIRPAGALR